MLDAESPLGLGVAVLCGQFEEALGLGALPFFPRIFPGQQELAACVASMCRLFKRRLERNLTGSFLEAGGDSFFKHSTEPFRQGGHLRLHTVAPFGNYVQSRQASAGSIKVTVLGFLQPQLRRTKVIPLFESVFWRMGATAE